MNDCGNFQNLHKNPSGSISYCAGCCSFHLTIKGVLTILTYNQLMNVERNLNQMKVDLVGNHSNDLVQAGVQIKLSKNLFLCLNFDEVSEAIELIEMGSYVQQIQDIVNS